jgi:DNA-directed RNA polymerase subunit RPC12/RpoP
MEVVCEQCKTKLNILDEKIPRDQVVRINCPKCRYRITLDTRTTGPELTISEPGREGSVPAGNADGQSVERSRNKESEEGYTYSDYSEDKALDFFEEGTRLSLIMGSDSEQSQKIKSVVEELGYKGIVTPNTRDALGKMRFHQFDVMVLSEGFDGQPLENSPILNHLNRLGMPVRRRIFLALLSAKFKSMDYMMSFAMSANAVFSTRELDRLGVMLKKAVSDDDKFYKVFMDTLAQLGKA